MEFASEMLVMASIRGLRVEEVPISYNPRIAPSKLHSFADGWRHLRFLFLLKPIPFLAVPGLLFSVLGVMLMGIFSLYGDVNQLHLNTFILGAFFLIGGVQFLLTALSIKTYSVVHGYDRMEGVAKFLMNYYNLEKMLVVGGILNHRRYPTRFGYYRGLDLHGVRGAEPVFPGGDRAPPDDHRAPGNPDLHLCEHDAAQRVLYPG